MQQEFVYKKGAHDFNNKLSVIIGHVDLARIKMDQAEPIAGHLDEINKAAEGSADLTGHWAWSGYCLWHCQTEQWLHQRLQ
jgi:hypothetical protein